MTLPPKLLDLREDIVRRESARFKHFASRAEKTWEEVKEHILEEEISYEDIKRLLFTAIDARLLLDYYLLCLKEELAILYGTEYTEGWTWKL